MDHKVFMYLHYSQLEPTSFIHTLCIAGHENNSTTFNGEPYQQFPCDILGMTITNFVAELKIPVFLDNGITVSIMPKIYYDQHEILHKCHKIPSPDYMVRYTDSDNTKVHFWVVIMLMMVNYITVKVAKLHI